MASYQVTAKSAAGFPMVAVSITSIDQDEKVVEEIEVVDAVRDFLAGADGVVSVVAQKYEQVITVV